MPYDECIHLTRFVGDGVFGGSTKPIIKTLSMKHILDEGIINAIVSEFPNRFNWKKDKEIIEKNGSDVITLSGSMFMLIKPEVIYLSSGNYEEYMRYNSQYLIQWELIKYGIKNKFKKAFNCSKNGISAIKTSSINVLTD